jgi:hypothetical protein
VNHADRRRQMHRPCTHFMQTTHTVTEGLNTTIFSGNYLYFLLHFGVQQDHFILNNVSLLPTAKKRPRTGLWTKLAKRGTVPWNDYRTKAVLDRTVTKVNEGSLETRNDSVL